MREFLKKTVLTMAPPVRRLREYSHRLQSDVDRLQSRIRTLESKVAEFETNPGAQTQFVDSSSAVIQYRRAYFEAHGAVAPYAALPSAKSWPDPVENVSYRDKLIGKLPLAGKGAEIGPLNLPLLSKSDTNVLYVDHLDTEGIRAKYGHLNGIVEIDRPMRDNSLETTLRGDAPLDYVVASQVMEHVPNPVRWLNEIASVLRVGGLLSISLPDRRMTFDLYRDETNAADMIAAYLNDATVPDARAVYDHHSLASAVNMHFAIPESVYPDEVIFGKGAVAARVVAEHPMELAREALSGAYLDVHCWVFTPTSFLLTMAGLAKAGVMQFRCKQFYPTNEAANDRDNHSFVAILEKVDTGTPSEIIRRSYLDPLG
ncbi:methyltransferase domain-containing protein [Bradyrhizobium barranii]|uniref:class I SAM-dependent methyltransferase n=1 Tax=Bradyrhizobium barranii TaxID=2992140 RepID=UPI0024AF991F|nr:methyltransferase domain-containing protein [Bradyrhizobium barranii]WFT91414.1 methyltransferase domain-containing protein [Bradyrhizobium barranii]